MLVKMVMISPFMNTIPLSVELSTSIGVVTHDEVVLIIKLRSYSNFVRTRALVERKYIPGSAS